KEELVARCLSGGGSRIRAAVIVGGRVSPHLRDLRADFAVEGSDPARFAVSQIISLVDSVARTLRAIIGVPDYERYVEHCRLHHPECVPMTRDQFAKDRFENKYSKPGTRC